MKPQVVAAKSDNMSKMKRLAAPQFWPIKRKKAKYTIKPKPGPHAVDKSMPLGVIIRDILGIAETLSEVKEILRMGIVMVDKTAAKHHNLPVGLMDVVSIGTSHYRMIPRKKGLSLTETKYDNIKLLKVKNKKSIKGKVQVNFHDGKNLLLDKCEYNTHDVVVFDLTEKQLKEAFKFGKDKPAIITEGSSRGETGKIDNIEFTRSSQPNSVSVSLKGRKIVVPQDYVFVLGNEKPVIEV